MEWSLCQYGLGKTAACDNTGTTIRDRIQEQLKVNSRGFAYDKNGEDEDDEYYYYNSTDQEDYSSGTEEPISLFVLLLLPRLLECLESYSFTIGNLSRERKHSTNATGLLEKLTVEAKKQEEKTYGSSKEVKEETEKVIEKATPKKEEKL
ncbi:hypothetical protein Tco_0471646 [Tanacetum coccineum]